MSEDEDYPEEIITMAAFRLALSDAEPSDEEISTAIIEAHVVWMKEHSSEIVGEINKRLENEGSKNRAIITPDGLELCKLEGE